MLSDYNIENSGIKISNKEETIHELETPFIAHIGSDFVVVYKITSEKVFCIWNKKDLNVSIKEFCKMWSGVHGTAFVFSSDYDLACKLALRGKIINIPDILMRCRVYEKQISSAHDAKQTEFANQIRLDYLERCGFRLSKEEKELFTLMMTDTDKASLRSQKVSLTSNSRYFNKMRVPKIIKRVGSLLNYFVMKKIKKLKLNKEAISDLTDFDKDQLRGGCSGIPSKNAYCGSNINCCNTLWATIVNIHMAPVWDLLVIVQYNNHII